MLPHESSQAGTAVLHSCIVASRRIMHQPDKKSLYRWLGTPKLVRETSRRHWWQRGKSGEKTSEEVKRDFSDIVLPGALQDHVRALAAVTANTRLHGAPFRHLLFYGPPGRSSCCLPSLALLVGCRHWLYCSIVRPCEGARSRGCKHPAAWRILPASAVLQLSVSPPSQSPAPVSISHGSAGSSPQAQQVTYPSAQRLF